MFLWQNQPPLQPLRAIQKFTTAVVVLFDQRSGHGNYFHHQTELIARTLWFLRDVYRPKEKKWKNVQFLIPPGVLLHLETFNAEELYLNMPRPEQIVHWKSNDRFYFKTMYTVDWTAPMDMSKTGVLGDQKWIKVAQPIWNVHFPPRSLLRLTHEAMRTSTHVHQYDRLGFGGRTREDSPQVKIVWYSRSDMEKRHVVGEEQVVRQLQARFGKFSVEIFTGGISFDVERNMKVFGSADLVVGPHGAGLANMLMCKKETSIVLLPSCDAVGCPSSADSYFGYLASALGFEMVAVKNGPKATFFSNYSIVEEQAHSIVGVVEDVMRRRGLLKKARFSGSDEL